MTLTACAGGGDRTLDEVANDMVEMAEELRDGFVALDSLGPNRMAALLDTNARLWDEAAEITPGDDSYTACADLFREVATTLRTLGIPGLMAMDVEDNPSEMCEQDMLDATGIDVTGNDL